MSTQNTSPNKNTPNNEGTPLDVLLTEYVAYIRFEKGLAAHSVEIYQSRLRHFIWRWLPENGYPNPDLTVFTLPVLRRYLHAQGARGLRPRTLRGMFHPIRSFCDFLIERGFLTENPARGIDLPKKDAADRKYTSDQELTAMMSAVERQADSRKVAFERALFSVLINCGPRAQELLDMRTGDFSAHTKTLVIRHGKGDKERILYPSAETLAAISEWLVMRGEMGCRHDWLWAITVSRRIGYDGLRRKLEEIKCLADLRNHNNIHCHSIRRAFAQRMMQRGATIKAIQSSMGHANAETTFEYLKMGDEESRVMSDLAALSRPAQVSLPAPVPEPAPVPPSPAKEVVKSFNKAAFNTHRRRTPAK